MFCVISISVIFSVGTYIYSCLLKFFVLFIKLNCQLVKAYRERELKSVFINSQLKILKI